VVERITTSHVFVTTGVERTVRGVGCRAMDAGQSTIVWASGLPIDRLNAILESGRGLELPLPNECPDDSNRHNARTQYSNDSDSGVLAGGRSSSGLNIICVGGLRA